MTAIDNAKFKLRQEMQALQRRLALLEEFEKQGYSTRTCEFGYHDWVQIPWEDGYVGLRYEGYDNDVVKDLHICVNCGVMRTTKFSRLLTDMEDPFKVLREEE
tara:strand:- start:270 stop:578 length:309 start_codon:yes stop_codon:yes gene_type:complete